MDEVILNKAESIERCLKRIAEEAKKDWMNNYTYQDALFLNLERVCQLCIDIGAHEIMTKKLGIPKKSREVFQIMASHNLIPNELSEKLQKMVGFRNLLVHEYGRIDLNAVAGLIKKDLHLFKDFTSIVLKQSS